MAFIRHLGLAAKLSLLISLAFLNLLPRGCAAADGATAPQAVSGVFVPSLFDPHNRPMAPDEAARKPIRFLTADDYPPFEFPGADGALAGFNVDMSRAICDELKVACTIQARRWDNLLDALGGGEGDAVIASLKATPETLARARFTSPYYLTPARFVALDGRKWDVRPEALGAARIGVEAGSAHEAFLRAHFSRAEITSFPDQAELTRALRAKTVDLVFGDAISLAGWMNASEAQDCCAFQGGPWIEPRYFGEGVGIAVRPDDDQLRRALNWALQRLDERGVLVELYLKYFPVGIY